MRIAIPIPSIVNGILRRIPKGKGVRGAVQSFWGKGKIMNLITTIDCNTQ